MLDIIKLTHFIEEEANQFSSDNAYNILFRAKSYASFLDSINDNILDDEDFTPIYIDNANGSYQAIPNLYESSQSVDISVFFKVKDKVKYMQFLYDFTSHFAGKTLTIVDTTAICNASAPIFSQVEVANFKQFSDFMNYYYKQSVQIPIRESDYYVIARFSLYVTSVANNSFIFSNSIKFRLEFTYNETEYSEDLVFYQASNGVSISPMSQQLVDKDKFATNFENITNYAKSIACYVKNNEFWRTFITLYNNRLLSDLENIKLVKIYDFENEIIEQEQIVLSVNENINIGDLLTYTFSFVDKGVI